MMQRTLPALLLAATVLAGCSANKTLSGQQPVYGSVISQGSVALSPNNIYSFETLAVSAAVAGLLYAIYDPLAPNWSIEEQALTDETYYLSLKAKNFRTGGDGEAMMILKRRALKLQREKGYSGYRILDYSEGVASSTPFPHRFSEGTIQLVRVEIAPNKP